jgi:TetR/AcrR family transcriptional regulator
VAETQPVAEVLGKRALRTRDQLIETAVKLFLERGYGGTTIDDIAEHSGMSRASFYTYFPSKRDVLLLAAARANKARTAAISAIAEAPDDYRDEDLKRWLRGVLAYLDQYGAFLVVWSHAAWYDDELRAMGAKGSIRTARVLGSHMQRLGAKSAEDPAILGMTVLSMLERLWYVWKHTQAPFNEDEVVASLAGTMQKLLH